MKDLIHINLNDFTWQLIIAILGLIFAIFALIHNEQYIAYGLITIVYGVFGHIVYKFFEWIFRKDGTNNKYYWFAHLSNAILAIVWVTILIYIY